jgi:hypothetical protein
LQPTQARFKPRQVRIADRFISAGRGARLTHRIGQRHGRLSKGAGGRIRKCNGGLAIVSEQRRLRA